MAKNENPLGGRGKALEDKWIREQEAKAAEARRNKKAAEGETDAADDAKADDDK